MAKPVVIAKGPVPEWIISYDDHTNREESMFRIFGSPSIEDAIKEAHHHLERSDASSPVVAKDSDWYTIIGVELVREAVDTDEP